MNRTNTPPTSTERVAKHRQLLAAEKLRYRSVLVHDDDVLAVMKYAASKLKRRKAQLFGDAHVSANNP